MSDVIFKNANNRIDGTYYHSDVYDSQIALIVYGDKNNYIRNKDTIDTIFNAFVENGFSVLKINFSKLKNNPTYDEEEFNQEIQELFDSTSSLNWLHEKNPEAKGCWICGFDAGAITTLQLVMRRPEVENYLLISPDIKKNELNFIVPCISSGMIYRSCNDELFSDEDLQDLQEKLITKTESRIETETLVSENRIFSDILPELKESISDYIKKRYEDFLSSGKNGMKDKKRRRRKKRSDDLYDGKIQCVNPIKSLDFDSI